jgi:hypothetical protein
VLLHVDLLLLLLLLLLTRTRRALSLSAHAPPDRALHALHALPTHPRYTHGWQVGKHIQLGALELEP